MIEIVIRGGTGTRDGVHIEVKAGGNVLLVVMAERDLALDTLTAYVQTLKDKALGN